MKGAVAVSVFLGQPPKSAWNDRTLVAIRRASPVAYHESFFLRKSRTPAALELEPQIAMNKLATVRKDCFINIGGEWAQFSHSLPELQPLTLTVALCERLSEEEL